MKRTGLLATIVGFAAIAALPSDASAYYHAQMGRFINRDPIGYRAGDANLYRYVGNGPISRLDPVGQEWTVLRLGQERAIAQPEECDTVSQLAKEIRLNPEEYRHWLRRVDGGPLPPTEDTPIRPNSRIPHFTVPNTAYIDVSTYTWGFLGWYLMGYKAGLSDRWNAEGLNVVYTGKWSTTVGTILGHLRSQNIYKFAYIGHGSEGSLTAISDPDGQGIVEGIIVADRYTPFRIAEMQIIACESNDGAAKWTRNVSRAGWLQTLRGRTSLFTGEFVDEGGAP